MAVEGISDTAAELISSSWIPNTTGNYHSLWKKMDWPVKWAAKWPDYMQCKLCAWFLGQFISIFHHQLSQISSFSLSCSLVEGNPVKLNIIVCNLMTGVFNKNPPKPRHTFPWDVEQVLKCVKGLSSNTELSDRTLLLKLACYFSLLQGAAIISAIMIYVTWWTLFQDTNFIFQRKQKIGEKEKLHNVSKSEQILRTTIYVW